MSLSETKANTKHYPMCGGFVVLCESEEKINVLLVKTHKNVWGFPKGKRKKHEPLFECALRECEEETGLKENQLNIIDKNTIFFDEITKKGVASVRLYLATTTDLIKPKIYDLDELAEAKWVQITEAANLLTHKNRKQILLDAIKTYENLQ